MQQRRQDLVDEGAALWRSFYSDLSEGECDDITERSRRWFALVLRIGSDEKEENHEEHDQEQAASHLPA